MLQKMRLEQIMFCRIFTETQKMLAFVQPQAENEIREVFKNRFL